MAIEYKATDLPGKILYDKQFSVQTRCITPIEQKYILSLSQKEQATNKDYIDFLKKLVVIDNPEMQFEDLYWFDMQYLLYRIRYLTYSKYPIKLTFKCPCGESIIKDLDIGTIQAEEPEVNSQKTVVLDNLGEMPIRNKIIRDDQTIEEFAKRRNIDLNDLQMRVLLLDLCLLSKTKSLDELYDLTETGEITANDIVTVESWFEHNIWGVKETVDIKCPKCGKEVSRGYVLSIEDFFSIV